MCKKLVREVDKTSKCIECGQCTLGEWFAHCVVCQAVWMCRQVEMPEARFPFKRNRLRCVNENRKKRRCFRHNKRKRQPIGMLGRSSGNHDWLLANASACVSCGFRLRNARKRLHLNGNWARVDDYNMWTEQIEKAVITERLTKSPCALVASQFGWSGNMERIMSAQAYQKTNDPNNQSVNICNNNKNNNIYYIYRLCAGGHKNNNNNNNIFKVP